MASTIESLFQLHLSAATIYLNLERKVHSYVLRKNKDGTVWGGWIMRLTDELIRDLFSFLLNSKSIPVNNLKIFLGHR